jgi:hypothetical protein
MKRKSTELNLEDNALVAMWIHTANICRLMNPTQFNAFVTSIENQYETCTETEVGDFLDEFIYTVQATNDMESHQDVQSLLDDYDGINEEIMLTIGANVNTLALQTI